MVEAVTRSGGVNTTSLIEDCVEAMFWSTSPALEAQAEAVINVFRRRGLLNDAGVALCRAELGPLSVAVIKENSK